MHSDQKLSRVFAALAAAIGLSALAGWWLDVQSIKTGIIGTVAMNPTTAVAFVLVAAGAWFVGTPRSYQSKAGQFLGVLVSLIGLVKLAEYRFDLHLGIDAILFSDRLAGNCMAPNTAVGFALAGFSLVLVDTRLRRDIYICEVLALCLATLGLFCLVGYVFSAAAMYGVDGHIPMAANTAVAFELIALAILLSRPERGLMGTLTNSSVGAVAARRLIPAVTILPIVTGLLRLEGQRAGLYGTEVGAALLVTVTIILLAMSIFWTARALNAIDAKRDLAERKLRLSYDELENRVAQRTKELVEANHNLERKKEDLKSRDDQLRQAQKMEAIGTLAGGVAHEFNNLLQAIQAYTQFALEGLDRDDARARDLQQVLEASNRASSLTRQLLGFGRRQSLELTNLNPNELIKDVVKLIRPLIGADIAVHVRLAENVGFVYADQGQFQQLMMNLCINARDAMPSGGQLSIKTQDLMLSPQYCEIHPDVEPGRYVAITVSDTGCGMPPDVMEHIFEPFFTTKGVGKGTGLGLAMVYGLIQQHRGVIRVYSEVGIGTTFKIYLPTHGSYTVATQDTERTAPAGGNETILIADDEQLVRDIYARILARAGYRLLSAADGKEAWDLFQANMDDIDLLMLDVVMPQRNGRDLHRQISEIKPDLPVIFCSGYDPETPHVQSLDHADYPFLQKPFDPHELLDTVRRVLNSRLTCQAT